MISFRAMRKRSSRTVRPVAKYMTPRQSQQVVLNARMGLELLCQGTATEAHLQAILGFLNLGSALFFLAEEEDLMMEVERAQVVLAGLRSGESVVYALPEGEARTQVLAVFNFVDEFVRKQTLPALQRAFDFLCRVLARRGTTAEEGELRALLHVDSPSS